MQTFGGAKKRGEILLRERDLVGGGRRAEDAAVHIAVANRSLSAENQ
jgi:hypothetical protein